MRGTFRHIMLLSSFLVGCLIACNAQEVSSTFSGEQFLIGDYIEVVQQAKLKQGETASWPDAKVKEIGIELLSEEFDTTDQTIVRKLTYIQFDSGKFVFPSLPVHILSGGDTTSVFETTAFPYYVSAFPLDSNGQARAIKDRLDVEYRPVPWRLFGFIGLCLLALILFLLYRYLTRKNITVEEEAGRPEPRKPIHEHATERIKALQDKKLWQQDKVKAYYSELSDIIREYVQFRFEIPVLERSTEEVTDFLMQRPISGLPTETRNGIISILRLADMVKFAKAKPLSDQHYKSMESALNMLDVTKPVEQEIEQSDSSSKEDAVTEEKRDTP
ncbi:MAG: hypothetical protein ACI959_001951 [Limisphaerales bacterium]|jgi:hypothetical protein